MAEIKSTIDLIMERTKNLSASREERETYQRREREKHIRGLIQRLLDYSLTLDDVKDELAKEKKDGKEEEVMAFLREALAGHVDPEADNERLFGIVTELAGTRKDRLRETLLAFQAESFGWKTALLERQNKELETKGVSGSAVVPNAEADPQWKVLMEEAQEACMTRFLGVINS
jgi:hypothetical protein